jgi:hypothetical protein
VVEAGDTPTAAEDSHVITGSVSSLHDCRSALAECLGIFAQRGRAIRLEKATVQGHDRILAELTLGGGASKVGPTKELNDSGEAI